MAGIEPVPPAQQASKCASRPFTGNEKTILLMKKETFYWEDLKQIAANKKVVFKTTRFQWLETIN